MRAFFDRLDAIHLSDAQGIGIMLLCAAILIISALLRSAKHGIGPLRGSDVPPGLDRDIRRGIGQQIPPAPGDRRHSNYFDGTIELINYIDDDHYAFKPIDSRRFPYLNGKPLRNQSAWSRLPVSRGGL